MIRENRPTSDPTRLYLHVYVLSLLNVTDEILIDTNVKPVLKFLLYILNLYIYTYTYILRTRYLKCISDDFYMFVLSSKALQ